jgi:hypothetical protein
VLDAYARQMLVRPFLDERRRSPWSNWPHALAVSDRFHLH